METIKSVASWVGSIAIAFIIALLISTFLIQPVKVMGHSMDPTLHDKERIFVSKLSNTFTYKPSYGDIVIIDSRVDRKRSFMDDLKENPMIHLFAGNGNDDNIYIKRVLGKAGDVLQIKGQDLYRNGKKLNEPYIKERMNYIDGQKYVVPKGHIFVLGDNRNHSSDSRVIGFIPLDHVLGRKL